MLSLFKKRFAYYIGSIVYGANDGIITTFAVVAGAAGAGFSSTIILVLGVANLVADGFSMGASKYLSMRSEQEVVAGNDVMHSRSAIHEALATFIAFTIAGSLPLLPFLFPRAAENAFIVSSCATGIALFLVGSARALVIRKHAVLAGLEMFLIGGAASALAYIFGAWVETLMR